MELGGRSGVTQAVHHHNIALCDVNEHMCCSANKMQNVDAGRSVCYWPDTVRRYTRSDCAARSAPVKNMFQLVFQPVVVQAKLSHSLTHPVDPSSK